MAGLLDVDVTEKFPRLSRAPVVEAEIYFMARSNVEASEEKITNELRRMLPEYPDVQRTGKLGDESTETRTSNWSIRCSSRETPQIAVFSKDGCLLSRLKSYENWERLQQEAFRIWGIFRQIAEPTEVQRLNVRFINRIELRPYPVNIGEYIRSLPQIPQGLPADFISGGFFHQDLILARGRPQYLVNMVKTIQPTASGEIPNLILDIEASRTQIDGAEDELLKTYLGELRWLKNKAFFGTITEKAMEQFM